MRTKKKNPRGETRAIALFISHQGILRSRDAKKLGIHPRIIRSLVESGKIEKLQRGLYALPNLPGHTHPDLATVFVKIPYGVLCLISALFFHNLTTQIPHFIYLTIQQGKKPPHLTYPPVKFYWSSEPLFHNGIEEYVIDGITIRCYSKEKTIVDCFRHRNKIGIDVAIEALKKYWLQGSPKLDLIMKYANLARADKIIKPYIESVINESS